MYEKRLFAFILNGNDSPDLLIVCAGILDLSFLKSASNFCKLGCLGKHGGFMIYDSFLLIEDLLYSFLQSFEQDKHKFSSFAWVSSCI